LTKATGPPFLVQRQKADEVIFKLGGSHKLYSPKMNILVNV
jgi:hypothetical protein